MNAGIFWYVLNAMNAMIVVFLRGLGGRIVTCWIANKKSWVRLLVGDRKNKFVMSSDGVCKYSPHII